MDNQFTPQPSTQTPQQPNENEHLEDNKSEDPMEAEAVNQPTSQAQETPTNPKQKKSKVKWVIILLVVLLLGALGLAAWQYTQVQSLQDDNAILSEKMTTATEQADQATAAAKKAAAAATTPSTGTTTTPATVTDIVTGEVSNKSVGAASVSVLYLAEKVTAIWVEYGTSPSTLSQATEHFTKIPGEGTAGTYQSQPFNLTKLATGTNYFYRAAATVNGQTIYSGVASFMSAK